MPPRNDPNPYNNSSLSVGGWLGIGKLSASGAKAMGVGIVKGLYKTVKNPVGAAVDVSKSIMNTASRVDDYAVLIQNSKGNYNTPRRQKARQEIAGKGIEDLSNLAAVVGGAKLLQTYAKNQAALTNIPLQKVRGKETWTAEEQSNYYATQAAVTEKTVRKMNHPAYYSDYPSNKQDRMFNQIEQIRLMNQADMLRKRANNIATGIPKKK
jgi:hypothetical protein